MKRKKWTVALLALTLVAASCGRDEDDQPSGGGAAAPTTAAVTAPNAPTTTADKCKSEALTATEIGVTATDITVTVMADVGSPLRPGLFQGNVDALNAYAKYVNANGGIGCRQVKVKTWDSKLDPTETRLLVGSRTTIRGRKSRTILWTLLRWASNPKRVGRAAWMLSSPCRSHGSRSSPIDSRFRTIWAVDSSSAR